MVQFAVLVELRVGGIEPHG